MDFFNYQSGELYAEDIKVAKIATSVDTPFYCYSAATLRRHIRVFKEALSALNPLICFAVKANSNLAILSLMQKEGLGADIVSEGELRRARAAGMSANSIVFSGVGKSRSEMAYALKESIFQFNVESEPELLALSEVASSLNLKAPIALRINPDVDAGTHAKISTGKAENKFGVTLDHAKRLYDLAATLPSLYIQGVSMHIGSQLVSLDPFRAAYRHAADFVQHLRESGHAIQVLDLGGGLGVPYEANQTPPSPADYAKIVQECVGHLGCQLVFEPGRMITANAGILVSRVLYVKESDVRRFVVLDAAMNDLVRPAMYDAYHEIIPAAEQTTKTLTYDIVGPVCESGDVFAKDRSLPPLCEGDLVALRTAGAYGAVMANQYNSRLLIPEVLVDGARFALIRKRPTYEDMLNQDQIPNWI